MLTPRDIAATVLGDKKQGTKFPTDLQRIVASIGNLELECLETDKRFEGRLELCGGKPTIFLNLGPYGIAHPRTRFTLGHELGHFFLHRHMLRTGHPIHDAVVSYAEDLPEFEREANEFSSELLLPTTLVKKSLLGKIVTLELVDGMAKAASASVPAAAIKVADLSTASLCFFWEDGGKIQWTAPTAAWRSSKHPSSAWRNQMPLGSYVAATDGSFDAREVPPGVWHPNHQARDPLVESALRTNHGRLIMVSNPNLDLIEGESSRSFGSSTA